MDRSRTFTGIVQKTFGSVFRLKSTSPGPGCATIFQSLFYYNNGFHFQAEGGCYSAKPLHGPSPPIFHFISNDFVLRQMVTINCTALSLRYTHIYIEVSFQNCVICVMRYNALSCVIFCALCVIALCVITHNAIFEKITHNAITHNALVQKITHNAITHNANNA